MANPEKLMFHLGFDLNSAVEGVGKDWPGYHKKLQKMVDKTPLKLKLKLDAKGLDLKSLRDYNKLTKEAALAAKRLADVEAKQASARKRNSDARVAEATEEARIAQKKAQSELTQLRLNDAIKNGVRSSNALTGAYSKQSTYLSRLVQRMGLYFGIHQFASILRNVRETTAEFELQRVSLGALIQDAHQAEVLFGQIKAAAVESPYQIKELVNYTKQMSAYGFEQEKLFSTTMQYADVAAGLGADMSRIILAMGQIRAASVLKGTELRQLTELGIPMVQLLSDKLSELRGELVSTGEVFSMISDKAISFNMVQEIFDDLTSSGGRFYNMQQKQAETLAGQWSNMKDTIAIAYDEIGNTERGRGAMEDWIAMTKNLAENWKSVSNTIVGFAITLGVIKTLNRLLSVYTANTNSAAAAQARLTLATKNMRLASKGGMFFKVLANQSLMAAKAMRKAAQASNFFVKVGNKLKAVFLGNWIMIVIAAIAALTVKLVNARQKANELKNELAKIGTEGAVKMEQSVRNFERLAKIAVDSVDGTKRQTDALNELKRTYGDIIPTQDLEIDKLRAMKNGYDSLTQAIREKIAMQTLEQKISTIESDYGDKINKEQKKFKDFLESTLGLSSDEIDRVISNVSRQAIDGTIQSANDAIQGLKKAISEEVGMDVPVPKIQNWKKYYDFIKLTKEREDRIAEETKKMEDSTKSLGRYTKMWEEAGNAIKDSIANITVSKNTKLYEEKVKEAKVKEYVNFLKKVMSDALQKDFDITKYVDGNIIDFTALFNIDGLSTQAKNAVRQVQDALAGMTGWQKHFNEFSRDMNIGGVDRKVFLYTEEEISNFGSLNDALDQTAKKYKELKEESERYGKALEGKINPDEKEQLTTKKQLVDEQKRQAYAILETYNALDLLEKKGGKGTDDWVTIWKNRAAVMKDFQQGVEDLTKKMGYAKALAAQQDVMLERGTSVGIDLTTKKGTADELKEWYKEQIAKLTGEIQKMGAKEGFAELSVKAILKKDTKNQLIQKAQSLLQWLYNQLTDFETKTLEEDLKKEIDRLAKAVARSKEAKDFYDKMLGMTGNEQLSTDLTMSIYGGVGDDLKENIKAQLENAFEGVNIKPAFDGDKIDWSKLNDLVESIPIESKREEARKLVNEGIKDNARWLLDLYKTYEKFQTYEERRTAVMKREEETRKRIRENASLKPEEKEKQLAASRKREATEIDTIDLEEFKASEDWIQTFENIDKVGTKSIQHLMVVLKEFIETNKDLTPEQIKTLMSEYNKLYEGLIARNPLKAIADGTREYFAALKEVRNARSDKRDANQEIKEAQSDITIAKADLASADNDYERAAAAQALFKAEERLAKGLKNREKAETGLRKAQDKSRAGLDKLHKGVNESAVAYNALGEVVNGIMETFNVDETSELGIALTSVSQALTMVAGVLGIINAMITLIESHPLVLAISAGIMAIIGAIMLFKNLKTADAEAKIEEMTKKLEELEYAYERLEKAQEKAFGSDYITNYNQRMENLLAQQEAYLAQADAERSKGKEADEQKAKDYEKSARKAADSIADAQYELSEHFLGTDVVSAARDFAKAWIDAYKEFGSTTDAMKEKFSEMVENMVVESLAAKVIQGHMQDIFDTVESLSKDGQLSVSDAAHIAELSKLATENIDMGMANLMTALEAAGISVRGMGSDLTGISKDIATASEESILGLAAGINTQNFYISQVPPKLDTIIAILQGGASPVGGINVQDLITIQNQHLAYLPNIADNTARTADRCERAAVACETILSKVNSVVSARGTASNLVVNTN